MSQIAILARCTVSFHNLIEKFYRSSYFFIARDSHMEWTRYHDLVLCRELLVINPFQAKYKTTARAKLRMAKERKESGINPTMSELDVLVEELVEREQTEKHQRENDGKLQ